MSSYEADDIEFNLGPREAVQSDRLEPDLESTSGDDTKSTVEMKAVVDQQAFEEEYFESHREEFETLLDPPAQKASDGANSRGTSNPTAQNVYQHLLMRIDELEAKQASLSEAPPVVKSEFRHVEHADLRSQSSSYVDDDELSRQTVEDALLKDRMRFMSNKIKDNTCKTFVDLLKGTNISKGDSNWVSWEGYFGSIVDTLELKHWLYQGVPIPLTMQDLLVDLADNNMRFLESEILPHLYRDTLGRVTIRYQDLDGVEIMNDEEKRRFDSSMMYVFSVLISCATNANLKGILDKNGATIRKDVPAMFKNLKDHFVLKTGSSITQKFLNITSVAHHDKSDKNSAQAIAVLRENKRALEGQGIKCPDIFFVSILLGTLDPDSSIKERMGLLVNEQGDNVDLETMIGYMQTWFRDRDIQSRNDKALGSVKTGKSPRLIPTNKLSAAEQKVFGECTRQGICYACFSAGTKDQVYKDCPKHFKKKSEGKATDTKSKVKSKKAKVMEEVSGSDHVEEVSISDGEEDDGNVSDDLDLPDLVDGDSSDDSDAEEGFQEDVVDQPSKYDSDDDEDSDDVLSGSRSGSTTNGGKSSDVSTKVSQCSKRKFVQSKETRSRSMQNISVDKCFELLNEATEAVAGIA